MTRNQILVIAGCGILCASAYLFADTKKHKTSPTTDAGGHNAIQQQQAQESLNIEQYITEVNSKVSDNTTKEKIITTMERTEKKLTDPKTKEKIGELLEGLIVWTRHLKRD